MLRRIIMAVYERFAALLAPQTAHEMRMRLAEKGCPVDIISKVVGTDEQYEKRMQRARETAQVRRSTAPMISVAQRSAPAASTAVPSHEQLVAELSRIDRQLAEEDRATDERNRQYAARLAAKIRRDSEDDNEEPGEGDDDFEAFSFDNCAKCGSDDLDISFNSDTDRLESRCLRCSFRSSRPALNQDEVSSAREHYSKRMRMKGARGY